MDVCTRIFRQFRVLHAFVYRQEGDLIDVCIAVCIVCQFLPQLEENDRVSRWVGSMAREYLHQVEQEMRGKD
jgi:hypothetical protein